MERCEKAEVFDPKEGRTGKYRKGAGKKKEKGYCEVACFFTSQAGKCPVSFVWQECAKFSRF